MENKAMKALPDPPEEDDREEKVYGNVLAELESVDLPLGTTLRYGLEFSYSHLTQHACMGKLFFKITG